MRLQLQTRDLRLELLDPPLRDCSLGAGSTDEDRLSVQIVSKTICRLHRQGVAQHGGPALDDEPVPLLESFVPLLVAQDDLGGQFL